MTKTSAVIIDSRTLLSILIYCIGLFFTSQSCVVNSLLDLGPVHQHSKGVSEEQLARVRFETPPVILYDWHTILRRTWMHITMRQHHHYHHCAKKSSIPPALCHCRVSGWLWDWFAHVLYKKMGKPLLNYVCTLQFMHARRQWMHVWTCTEPWVQKQPANTLRVAVFLILENLAGYNLLHHLGERQTSSRMKNLQIYLLI